MSDLDAEEEQILAKARRVWTPSDADAARVLRATSLALGLPVTLGVADSAGATTEATAPSETAVTGAARAGLTTGKLAPLTAAASKWLAGLIVVGAAAGGGYVYGFRAGREVSRREAVRAVSAAPVVIAAPAIAPLPRPTVGSEPPKVVAAAPPPPSAAGPSTSNALTSPAGAGRSLSKTLSAPSAPTERSAHAPSLQAELRALRRVESALRDGKPEIALRVLAQLDRDNPRGNMLEERAAAWALARCGRSRSNEVAADFAQHHPASVYAERVIAACDAPAAVGFENPRRDP
jgi:hypothetical protein